MTQRFRCPNCAEYGWMLSDEPTRVPFCLNCGHRVEIQPLEAESSPREDLAIDEAVVSWLADAAPACPPKTDTIASCVSCGWHALMPYDSSRGDAICPACLAVYRTKPVPVQQLIDCPNCTRSIEVYESDRGKTIVCSGCNYFVGCVLLPERRRFNSLPFLNSLLGPAKN